MTCYKLLIINGMGTKYLNLSTQMVVEPILEENSGIIMPEITPYNIVFSM